MKVRLKKSFADAVADLFVVFAGELEDTDCTCQFHRQISGLFPSMFIIERKLLREVADRVAGDLRATDVELDSVVEPSRDSTLEAADDDRTDA